MNQKIRNLIRLLHLQPHPEGGYYREIYRSDEIIRREHLPDRYQGDRSLCTAIYYLLTADDYSAWHRIKSDEIWHCYAGDGLEIFIINEEHKMQHLRLGADWLNGQYPQVVIKRGHWFAARPIKDGAHGFCLVGCTVVPGFEFADFELADPNELLKICPGNRELIIALSP